MKNANIKGVGSFDFFFFFSLSLYRVVLDAGEIASQLEEMKSPSDFSEAGKY